MTLTIAVNDNNDIFINNDGNIPLSTGIQAVLETCMQAARTLLGEMVLDTPGGLPDFQAIWVGVPNVALFEAYLRANILAVSGVVDIVNLTISIQKNVLSYTIVILTEFGQIALVANGSNIVGQLLDQNGNPLLLEDGSAIFLE